MKVITTNLLNRFWKNGVLENLKLKVDTKKIVNNFTTTVAGNVADARALKTLRDLITGLQTKTDELNGNLNRNYIQNGNISSSGINCPQNTITNVAVDFPEEYAVTPKVFVQLMTNSTVVGYGNINTAIKNVSTTGFEVNIYNAHTAAVKTGILWMAIGKK